MEKRQLGRSALMVAPLAFGGNVFGWTIDEKQSFGMLDAFVAAGCNLVDTADVYPRWATGQGGESETIIGNWIRKRNNRKEITLATKVGMDVGDPSFGLSRKYIIRAVEASLKRLRTDYIDLYQSHKDDLKTPVEETLEAYAQLIREGKVRAIGASNFSAERLRAALEASVKYNLPRYECIQPHYNLCEREIFENELEGICHDNEIAVITYYSLASGFLTGKYRSAADLSKSVRGKGASKYMNEKGFSLLGVLDEIAAAHKVKPAAVAIAWLVNRPSVTAAIASATSVIQLNELLEGLNMKLNKSESERIGNF
jgi:aryl-alcohol dehydrogenase-like predicted oxidoreductase